MMRIFAGLLAIGLSGVFTAAAAQDSAANKAAALASLGKDAVHVITSQYVFDGETPTPKTGKPLSTKGKWSIGMQAPKDCPQTPEACVSVFYKVPDEHVACEWTVLLLGDDSSGRVLEENDDAARYLVVRLNQSDAGDLVVERKQPIYPPIALAAHIQGEVAVRVTVATDGALEQAQAAGPSMLLGAAIDGAKQWRFKPFLVGTRSVRFQTNLMMSFSINNPLAKTIPTGKVTMKP
jgi:TonB family protein